MSTDTESRLAPLPPISLGLDTPGASTVEKEIATLRFGNPPSSPQSETEDDPVETSQRTAEVLRALFPAGVTLRSDEDFAFFHLFSHLVGTVSHFADIGMRQPAPLREIVKLTELLDAMLPAGKPR